MIFQDSLLSEFKMRMLDKTVSQDFLPRIEQPSRYIGREHNSYHKNPQDAEISLVLGFPDSYDVGISHLGTQVLYALANNIGGVAADRCYCPTPSDEKIMREANLPLFGVESRCAVGDFDLFGISLSYEMSATNVLTMLDLAGIPLRAADRNQDHPIVIGGGTQADSPEPMADFFDIVHVGDGEKPLAEFIELYRKMKLNDASRAEILLEAAKTIESAYVPSLWQPKWDENGKLCEMRPLRDDIPAKIKRSVVKLADSPDITKPLVPMTSAVFDRISIEIMRGCPHGCRFCHAGFTKKPIRKRSIENIVSTATEALKNTGFREISLLSLSTGDYPQLTELLAQLDEKLAPKGVSIAVPSLRIDKQLSSLPERLNKVRKGGMTIAAEVGSDKLRKAINKRISNEDMLAAVEAAYRAGWRSVKVYFMAGFPGESESDIEGIMDLCTAMSEVRKKVDGHKGSVSASVSWLVPKAHTPLQWAPQAIMEYFWSVRNYLNDVSRRTAVNFKFHLIERSLLEAVIARGDRRMCDVIENAWQSGARYDGWREHFNFDLWTEAFEKFDMTAEDVACKTFSTNEILPWSHIEGGCAEQLLVNQWEDYQRHIGDDN